MEVIENGPVAVLEGPYGEPYRFMTQKSQPPGRGEALIQIEYSGICHGDIYARDGGGPAPSIPFRPLVGGHEGIGYILAIGLRDSQTPKTEAALEDDTIQGNFNVGDRVGVAWRQSVCGTCDACQAGFQNFCAAQVITGMGTNGTYQRFINFPVEQLHKIPDELDPLTACSILCAGVTSYSSLQLLPKVVDGDWVAIVGAAGALGHLAIQYAKIRGLKVLAIDSKDAEKQHLCQSLGAEAYLAFDDPEEVPLVERVRKISHGGVRFAIVLSAHQTCYDDAGQYTRFGGNIIAVAVGSCHMKLRSLLQKGITVQSTQTGTKAQMQEALRLAVGGGIRSATKVVALKDLNTALDRLKGGQVQGKLVIDLSLDK